MTEQEDSTPSPERYDVLVVAASPKYRMPNAAASSLIRSMAVRFWVSPNEELISDDWAEVYGPTGPSSHEIFTQHEYDTDVPVFHEAAIRFGQEPTEPEYGVSHPLYFWIEFRGCMFKEPNGRLFKLIKDSLYLQCKSYCRVHESIPERPAIDE